MRAAVVITTKNRRKELARSIQSALVQTARPEILVVDDGSEDGTADMVAQEFPSVQICRSETSLGLVVQRNRAAHRAHASILFSLDDDAAFSSPTIVERTLAEFDEPHVGAVAIPFIEVNRSSQVLQKAPSVDKLFATYDFIGTAHAIRRDVFLSLGGYREILFHQGEEEDFCVRMLDAGWFTRCGNADPIHHFESPRRSWTRMDFYGARNKIIYAWHNVPTRALPKHLAGTTARTLLHTLDPRRFLTRLRGITAGYLLCAQGRVARQPISVSAYRLSRELRLRRFVPLDEVVSRLRATVGPKAAIHATDVRAGADAL